MNALFLKLALAGDVWVLWLLLLASLVSVAVMADRWMAFRRTPSRMVELLPGLTDRLEAGDVGGALEFARGFPTMEGRVAQAGLERFAKGPAAVEDVIAAIVIQERLALEHRLIILGTLGNNAPFVGLFGTVLGIIRAFNDLAVSGSGGVTVVMSGISSALVATAFGILVAIPAVIANNYFRTRLRTMVSNCETLTRVLLAHLKAEGPGRAR